jgi:hypothetical protein
MLLDPDLYSLNPGQPNQCRFGSVTLLFTVVDTFLDKINIYQDFLCFESIFFINRDALKKIFHMITEVKLIID